MSSYFIILKFITQTNSDSFLLLLYSLYSWSDLWPRNLPFGLVCARHAPYTACHVTQCSNSEAGSPVTKQLRVSRLYTLHGLNLQIYTVRN